MPQIQIHYELSQWEEAFQTHKENRVLDENVAMILSANPHTLGYWVESKPDKFQLPKTDKIYVGAEVDALENRVRTAISQGRPNRLIY